MPANDRQVGGDHYKTEIQHWDLVEANKIPYMEAQILRYVMRHAKKGGRSDLEKAKHYIEKLMELRYPLNQPTVVNPQVPPDVRYALDQNDRLGAAPYTHP